jgi:5'-nucleotidase (lipoprotein e(P4) family)
MLVQLSKKNSEKKTVKTRVFCLIALFLLPVVLEAREPANLSLVKAEVICYYQTGEYSDAMTAVASMAKCYLARRIQGNCQLKHPQKLAIVVDLDETLLSNYRSLRATQFSPTAKQLHAYLKKGEAQAIYPTLNLVNYADNHGVAVFFVTGRSEKLAPATIKNIHRIGFSHWTYIYFKPNYYRLKTIIPFKTQARRKICQRGYTVVLNIGDQNSDLVGGYSEKCFKLPNPFYFLP